MNFKQRISYTMLLMASLFVLLSVVLPHHHHMDGTPCYEWLWQGDDISNQHHHTHDSSHEADCSGHNQALNPTIEKHVIDNNPSHFLQISLFSLLYTLYPDQHRFLLSLLSQQYWDNYPELLYISWLPEGVGLRAPPFMI